MKKIIIATTVAMALSAAAAHADSTAVLKLKGVLTNDACYPELTNGGVVDFGTKYVSSLSATNDNQLGYKDISLTITCSAASKVAWSITDNNADSMKKMTIDNATTDGYQAWGADVQFGVGKTAGGVNIGAYSVAMEKTVAVDGGTKRVGYSSYSEAVKFVVVNNGATQAADSSGVYMYSPIDDTTDEAIPFLNAVFPLRVALAVQKTDTLAITDDTPIDGQATITLHYL
ncbi:DUF1120 domain-containing protein [Salmonella enterica subsp. enterica]